MQGHSSYGNPQVRIHGRIQILFDHLIGKDLNEPIQIETMTMLWRRKYVNQAITALQKNNIAVGYRSHISTGNYTHIILTNFGKELHGQYVEGKEIKETYMAKVKSKDKKHVFQRQNDILSANFQQKFDTETA